MPLFQVANAFMRKALPVVPFCTCAIPNSPALSVTLFHSFVLPHFLFWSWLLEDTEPSAAATPLALLSTLIRVNTVYSPSPPQCLRRINLCSPRTSRRAVTHMATNGPMAYSTAFLHLTLVSYRHLHHCPSFLRPLVENLYQALQPSHSSANWTLTGLLGSCCPCLLFGKTQSRERGEADPSMCNSNVSHQIYLLVGGFD